MAAAIGNKLRKLLYFVTAILAVLVANSVYLATITFAEWVNDAIYQNYFYQLMFLAHLLLGLLLIVPFIVFALIHMKNTKDRKNRNAVRVGYGLFGISVLLLLSGLLLMRIEGVSINHPTSRQVIYWLHVVSPLVALWLYVLHRLVGPKIQWKWGVAYAAIVLLLAGGMAFMHMGDSHQEAKVADTQASAFAPSLIKTPNNKQIEASAFMNDEYCAECHQDVHRDFQQSVHKLSSFNNPAYLASIRGTIQKMIERDGNKEAARWCAGCHDPVPLLSGKFDEPDFDVQDITAHAGITCSVCHGVTSVDSTTGNADFTIEAPQHYPFAESQNDALKWISNQLLKAKPTFHKKMFLKPFHKTAEFCSTCHKVSLPGELTGYKEFLRGQNHYDSYLFSGVSGHGARSFYYPPVAQENCNGCHMPLQASNDMGAIVDPKTGQLSVHNHMFPGANTGIAWMLDNPEALKAHKEFLEGCVRVDLFGIREEGTINGELHAPLRPELPVLKAGNSYLLESVIRTLKVGHHFTQGTVDSNEIWLDITIKAGDQVIGRSGGLDEQKEVDPWAHFVNAFVLDENGNRISTRNAEDIVTPLYNHQIPPGAGQTVHYKFTLPQELDKHITITAKLQYRKFDKQYIDFVRKSIRPGDPEFKLDESNDLPIVTLATDEIMLPVEGVDNPPTVPPRDIPEWQRWNDYGIGLLLRGKSQLRQAADAFQKVEELNRYDGPLNLARVLLSEGRVDEAVEALQEAATYTDPPAPPWTLAWFTSLANWQQGRFTEAEDNLRSIIETVTQEKVERGFDFSLDIQVLNQLGTVLFDQARQQRGNANKEKREELLRESVEMYQRTLKIDAENVTAHYNLSRLYEQLDEKELAEEHRQLHIRYKPDDTIAGTAVRLAREKYPAADHAAEELVIYPLQREGAPK